MADAQPSTTTAFGVAATSGAAVAAAVPTAAGTKDPRAVMETVLVKLLSIYEQLANSTVLLSTPQVG